MGRFYRYQGPQSIAQAVAAHPEGTPIRSVADFEQWIHHPEHQTKRSGSVAATFVITQEGVLCLADRHSEHVACAGGQAVLSAGEIFFALGKERWEVSAVSNQSTGYCPEPASWSAIAAALDQIPLPHPGAFTHVFLFRRCSSCHQLNLVKDEIFLCALCDCAVQMASFPIRHHSSWCEVVSALFAQFSRSRRDDGRTRAPDRSYDDLPLGTMLCPGVGEALPPPSPKDD